MAPALYRVTLTDEEVKVLGDVKERLGFTDEARAYMFASVVENTFRLKAKVVEGPHGWIVAVAGHEPEMTILEMSELYKMQGACMVLYDYTVSPAQNACADDSKNGEKVPSPEARAAWHDRKTPRWRASNPRLRKSSPASIKMPPRARKRP